MGLGSRTFDKRRELRPDQVLEATYLFGCPEGLPPGGDVLADLAKDGPSAASGGHVSLAWSLAGVEVLLNGESEYDGIESLIWIGTSEAHRGKLIFTCIDQS